MREEIQARLQSIEIEEQVRIVYACESGSRAWGFPSADSDYDVRFIYLHPRDWYLSVDLERKRAVIERVIDGQLDINGWDLRKALQLLRKGNPPLMEWLGSPIVYLEEFTVADQMRDLTSRYYSPVACLYHYLHMARGNYRDYLKGPMVWVKKYFYVLRPLLAIKWIERGLGVVPTEFQVLVDQVVDSSELRDEIGKLVAAKRRGEELERGPRIERISEFIEDELVRLESKQFEQEYDKSVGPVGEFNRVFRAALEEVWS
ncbi:MAG: nucleotidyltransferase domain-containing protein [Chloroflexota bacterium]